MKLQYTFNAELEDVQEILYQKYTRAYNKNDLSDLHQKLKVSCLEKKSFKEKGGISIDIGSVFDFWVGKVTRGPNRGKNSYIKPLL